MNKVNEVSACKEIRKKILYSVYNARSGHIGPSLSCVEIIYLIFKLGINYKKKK